MSDNDMIRRGDALAAVQGFGYGWHAEEVIAALPAVTVGVKPLVWEERNGKSYRQANCVLGQYQVSWLGEFECWQLSRPRKAGQAWKDGFSRHSDKDAAKAAAQADYEARIVAALEPVQKMHTLPAPTDAALDMTNVQKMHIADPAAIREAALREAVDCCTYVIKNMAILKADGETYETPRVQKIARGLVDVARQDILALIQKGGDALDQAVPIDARPATSPGVTAGAIREAALFEAWTAVWEAKSLLDAKNALHALISKGDADDRNQTR